MNSNKKKVVRSKKDLPLSAKEKELLLKTPQNAFKVAFPNHTRAFLIVERRRLEDNLPIDKKVNQDITFKDAKDNLKETKSKNDFLMSEIQRLSEMLKYKKALDAFTPTLKIEPSLSAGGSEATAVVLLSDWHIDEVVDAASVNYLNKYDYSVAKRRVEETFQTIGKLVSIFKRDIEIKELVIGLIGDFISGTIHDDLMENNSMGTMTAVKRVVDLISAGTEFLLKNTEVNLTFVCCVGNHSRITKKQRISTEKDNALETLIYQWLADKFSDESRIKFVMNEGYHTYVDIYSYTIRFHHGHAIKYGGGIGGLFIPAYKAISQWNKAKNVYLDCFGHFHQMKDGGSFISNGSVIGYNAYAINIKADYEKSKQAFFLIDKKRGKTVTVPIITNGD